ncbi:hypothetical protein ABEB36_000421 [Hypothenemus hampei]|uniref:Protein kinase domain-containing protein n=1 Tax=Hypothenemus hampei TaxID=57062 RepID=A0ABD1FBN9_HYPHA
MKHGLGQLVDGLYGDDDYQKQVNGEQSGTRWVGWSRSKLRGNIIEILVEFDVIRDFHAVHLHTNNMFTRSVQVFSTAEFWFSLDGDRFQSKSVKAEIAEDRERQSARNITILLEGRVARFIKIRLSFVEEWIMLSEMSFDSRIFSNNTTTVDQENSNQSKQQISSSTTFLNSTVKTPTARKEMTGTTTTTTNNTSSLGQAYIGLITGIMAMIILLIVCTAFLMIRRKGKKKVHTVALLHKHTSLVSCNNVAKPNSINMNDLKTMSTPIISNGISRSNRLSVKSKNGTIITVDGSTAPAKKQKKCNLYGHVKGEESDSENSSVYHEPYKLLPNGKAEYGCLAKREDSLTPSKKGEYTDFTSVNSFHEEIKFTSPAFYNNLTSPPPPPPPALRPQSNYEKPNYQISANGTANTLMISSENYYAATDVVKGERRREQHFTPGRFTSIKLPEGPPLEGVAHLLDFPRHRLRLLEKLGEGDFGLVHLCEAEGLPDFNGGSTFHKKQLVIVKSLWRGCGDSKRHEFLRETSWLAALRDPNLARVLGFCSQDEPMCAILEHTDGGELPKFLETRVRLDSNSGDPVAPTVSYGSLIYVATQIASGMKYLESLDLVHRDLAARNCLIDKNYTVKISDHAIYCDRYENEYYVSDTKTRLPIRWMSWEALLLVCNF